jgi:hypothetical protein
MSALAVAQPLTSTREGVSPVQASGNRFLILLLILPEQWLQWLPPFTDTPPLPLCQPPIISFLLTPTVSNVRLSHHSCV